MSEYDGGRPRTTWWAPGPRSTGLAFYLRVVSWNLLYDALAARLEPIRTQISALRPDVALLQELTADTVEPLAAALGMHASVCGTTRGHFTGVFTAEPHHLIETIELESPDDGSPSISAAQFRVGDQVLVLASVHLTASPSAAIAAHKQDPQSPSRNARLEQIDCLLGRPWTGERTIVAGDFNALPDSLEYNRILESGLTDVWRHRPRVGGRATIVQDNPLVGVDPYRERRDAYDAESVQLGRRPAERIDFCLDYQFVTPGVVGVDATTFGRGSAATGWPSDHLGLVVDYEFVEHDT